MSDWPAEIDPSPATKPHQPDQPQFTLRALLWTIAGVGVLVVIALQLGVGWAIFATVLLGLGWFGGSAQFAARLKRIIVAAAGFAIVLMIYPSMGDGAALRSGPMPKQHSHGCFRDLDVSSPKRSSATTVRS